MKKVMAGNHHWITNNGKIHFGFSHNFNYGLIPKVKKYPHNTFFTVWRIFVCFEKDS